MMRPSGFGRLILIIGFGVLLMGSDRNKTVHISGETMGTTYHITVVAEDRTDTKNLADKITRRLLAINQSMSTYLPASEINRFNAIDQPGETFCPTKDFSAVMAVAEKIYRLTDGAWDGTVAPLVELWGFGRSQRKTGVPAREEIETILPAVGFDKIDRFGNGCLAKRQAAVQLNLASIAKGYGVDAVSALIRQAGYDRFLVEIGGEVYARGFRADSKSWQIGIATPLKGSPLDSVYQAVALQDQAMATSGTYRNYFEAEGKTFSHVLDPRTGYPVQNGVVSATVVAPDCTFADGLATALMVLDPAKGLALVEGLEKVECLMVVQEKNGQLTQHASPGFFTPHAHKKEAR